MPNSFTVATTVLPPAVKSIDLDKLTICRIPFLNIKAKLFCIGEFYVKSTDWNQYNEPGIYFLLEQVALNDNNYRTPFVYIGQAKEIGERLKTIQTTPTKLNTTVKPSHLPVPTLMIHYSILLRRPVFKKLVKAIASYSPTNKKDQKLLPI